MLRLGNKSLTYARAKEILENPQNIWDKPAVQPKGGEGYLYRSPCGSGRNDFQCDQYRFIHIGKYSYDKTGVCKRYYHLKDPDGKLKEALSGFKRHVYSLILAEESDTESSIVYLVHYIGDSTRHRDSSHGNAIKKKDSVFVHTSRTCLDEIKKDDKNTPKQTYLDLQAKGMRQSDQSRMPTYRPRDVKQCENIKYTKRQSLRISKDTVYNALEMSDHTDDFVRMIEIYPDITIRMAHSDMLDETRNILKISMKNTELPQVLSYDTTFSLGDFYVSVLVCRNVLLVGDPIFPVAFMVHEKKFMKNHEQMFRDILHCLGMDKCSNIPFVTDREKGITKPLHDFFPDLPKFFCLNHILKDAERWLRKNYFKKDELSILLGDIRKLVLSDGEEQFNDQYHTLANRWPGKFRAYFDKHLKGDISRNTCRFRTKHFSAFSEGPPTNNISESMNNVLKAASGRKEMALDAIILWFHQLQTNYLHDFRRAECGHGQYALKKEFKFMRKHLKDIKFPEMLTLDDIISEINKDENLTKFFRTNNKVNQRFTQRAMARWCGINNMVGFSSTNGVFTVGSMTQRQIHCVQYYPKPPSCSCSSTTTCYHILAVAMALRDKSIQKEIPCSLSQLLKNRKGRTRKSGRKRPRRGDFDYIVNTPAHHSTPKKQSPKKQLLNSDLSMISDEDMSEVNEEALPLDLTADSVKLLASNDYPWLSSSTDKNPQHVIRQCLKPEQWLDDETIEQAIQAFCTEKPWILFFNLFLYRWAEQNHNASGLCRFALSHEAANKDFFIILVHVQNHWILAVVNLSTKTILVMDSFISHNRKRYEDVFRNIFKLISACFSVANVRCKIDDWQFSLCRDVEQQQNTFDCGIHVIANAYCVTNNLPLSRDFPSGKCRVWVDYLVGSRRPSTENHLSFGISRPTAATQSESGSVLDNWHAISKNDMPYTELVDSSSAFAVTNKSKWAICDSSQCQGSKDEDQQIMCVVCGKWFHKSCLVDENADDLTYFICYRKDCLAAKIKS